MKSLYRKTIDFFSEYPDLLFFFAFLLTFPFTIRKIIFSFPINNSFNEFTSGYLYLSDIYLIITFLIFLIDFIKNKLHRKINSDMLSLFAFSFVLALFSYVSIYWSDNFEIALYYSIRLLLVVLLFFYLFIRYFSFSPSHYKSFGLLSSIIIISIAVFNSLAAIFQFVFQRSIGLIYLGESYLAPNLAGVAKLTAFGHKFIRGYGFFPHPNILAGFLLFSIIITYLLLKSLTTIKFRHDFLFLSLIRIFILVQAIALFLTFSKTAYAGLIIYIGSLCFLIFSGKHTVALNKLFLWIRRFYSYIVLSLLVMAFVYTCFYSINLAGVINKSINERQLYIDIAFNMIKAHPILGIGSGQFVHQMANYSDILLRSWEYQPVHNIFLLLWSEFGIIGLGLFISFALMFIFRCSTWNKIITDLSKNVPPALPSGRRGTFREYDSKIYVTRGTLADGSQIIETTDIKRMFHLPTGQAGVEHLESTPFLFNLIILPFLPAMLFDHYLWDIHQGLILLFLIFSTFAYFRLMFRD